MAGADSMTRPAICSIKDAGLSPSAPACCGCPASAALLLHTLIFTLVLPAPGLRLFFALNALISVRYAERRAQLCVRVGSPVTERLATLLEAHSSPAIRAGEASTSQAMNHLLTQSVRRRMSPRSSSSARVMPRTCKTPHDPDSACCTTALSVANCLPHAKIGHLYGFSPPALLAPA